MQKHRVTWFVRGLCWSLFAAGLGAAAFPAHGLAAGPQVDSPFYKSWASQPIGTVVVQRIETTVTGRTKVAEPTQRLQSVTAEKAVVEMSTMALVDGQKMARPSFSIDVPAKLDRPPEMWDPTIPKTKGREVLSVAGKKLDCEWVQTELLGNVIKTWTSDKVPGLIVKQANKRRRGDVEIAAKVIRWGK